ncbi:hypothetical protein [Ureaplasma ceti]|uniref:Uncharacterized protein n=1 Tax=Ureaplasma ceti TaxID=3119530 RepID=A0ABP9U5E8_9BACT
MNRKNDNLEIIQEIPDAEKYQDSKISKKSSWFNSSIALMVLVLFILIGVIIAVAVSL